MLRLVESSIFVKLSLMLLLDYIKLSKFIALIFLFLRLNDSVRFFDELLWFLDPDSYNCLYFPLDNCLLKFIYYINSN